MAQFSSIHQTNATPNDSTTDRPLRVVHCVLSLDVGGLERIVVDLVRLGTKHGSEVSVLCLERPGVLATEATAYGATITCLNKPPGIVPETIHQAEAFLQKWKPDVIHTHQIGALWYVGQAARRVGVPVVLHTEHIDHVVKLKGLWRKLKCRILWHRAAQYADRFCCVSKDIARSAVRWWTVPRRKVEVVLNGVETEIVQDRSKAMALRREFGISETALVIGNVARLNEVKRQDLLLRGFARVRAMKPNVHLLLVGDGPERQRLEELTDELGISSSVTFAGYQSRPEQFYQIMDVFALTSRLEGLPLSLLEAWAARLPVVATAVGGVPEVVRDGENGLLIKNGDEDGLVNALNSLLDKPEIANLFAERGQRLVQGGYSLLRMATDYELRYRQLLAKRQRGEPCASSQ